MAIDCARKFKLKRAATAIHSGTSQEVETPDVETPVRYVNRPGLITTNQTTTPTRVQSVFESRVYESPLGSSSHACMADNAHSVGTYCEYGVEEVVYERNMENR